MTSPARLRGRRAVHHPPPAAAPARGPRAGFVLYVSVPDDEHQPGRAGRRTTAADIAETVDLLRELAQEALPGSEAFAALSLVPGTTGDVRSLGDRLTHLRLVEPAPATEADAPDVLTGSGDAG